MKLFFDRAKQYFPQDKKRWKMYLSFTLPIMFSSILFAVNSFVDNFMVGHVKGGLDALFAANSWTSIIFGIYIGIAVAGAILMAQYFYSGHIEKAKEIARLRFLLNIFVTIGFVISAFIVPDKMIMVFAKKNSNQSIVAYNLIIKQGVRYIRIISISWILTALAFNMVNIYREQGYAKVVLYSTMLSLSTNIILNSITLFVFHLGTAGVAISTVISRVVTITIIFLHHAFKKTVLALNPLLWFRISKQILREYFSRSLTILLTAGTMIFITLRNIFYSLGYPLGSISADVSAGTILALTNAIMNVFTTTFNAIGATAARYVGAELGKNNIEQAKSNAKEIKGFLTIIASILSTILFLLTFAIPSMSFLVGGQQSNAKIVLKNAKYSLWPLAFLYPWWIWFRTGNRAMLMGGKVNLLSIMDSLTAGPMQLGWLAIVMLVIVPSTNMSFPLAYLIFFISDIPRGIVFEVLFYKMDWAHSITRADQLEDKATGQTLEMRRKQE